MDFPHRIAETFLELRRAATIRGALERLTSRALSDLGITREDVPHIARVGARMAPRGASYVEIVAEARDRRLQSPTLAARFVGAAKWVQSTTAATGLGRWLALELVWWRAYRRIHGELATYSDRELMADLRLSRSDIDGIAVEGADAAQVEFVRAHPAHRRYENLAPGLAASSGRQLPAD